MVRDHEGGNVKSAGGIDGGNGAAAERPQIRQIGTPPGHGHRLGHLETLRGLAALIVFAYHTTAAFDEPAIRMGVGGQHWFGSPLFVLVNGGAAILLFFVLSGYVLTIGALRTANLQPILLGAIKRWPRLAGPVLLAVLFSW